MSSTEEERAGARTAQSGELSAFSRSIDFLSSVKFGIILLILLILTSVVGMLVTQYNIPGFAVYYSALGPFRQTLYNALGLFDIYSTWYFNALLCLLALNIIGASIERFPATWKLITRPNLRPSQKWIRAQGRATQIEMPGCKEDVADTVAAACRKLGWRRLATTESGGRISIFAESGRWNRLGAYLVHAALLTILAGGFVTAQFSFSGQMPIAAGETSAQINEIVFRENLSTVSYRRLPFKVKCVDLEQRLIDPKGPLESANSIDWITKLEISDENGTTPAVVQLNRPFDYRGYRIFHSSFLPIGKARSVVIAVDLANGGSETVRLGRDETAELPNGVRLRFVDFRANLSLTRENPNENSVDYRNPAATLEATTSDGERRTIIAFRDNQPGDRANISSFGGVTVRLLDFEKVSDRHLLLVRRDPGSPIVYAGFVFLAASLAFVFLFSHQRVWCAVEQSSDSNCRVTIGGNTNRGDEGFESGFQRLVHSISNS